MRTIQIRYNSFRMVLDADALGEIPRMNFRKLLKLAYRDSQNEATLRELGRILEENAANNAVKRTKAELNSAKSLLKIFKEMEINKNGSSNNQ